jgi:hypothetical protein
LASQEALFGQLYHAGRQAGVEDEPKSQTKLINLRDYQLLFCDGKDDESGYPQRRFSFTGRSCGYKKGANQ